MQYVVDHDFHIHSHLSPCSGDPGQTPENILSLCEKNGLKSICLTDHMWDSTCGIKVDGWYGSLNREHIRQALPLPQSEKTHFFFGCEADMDKNGVIGISDATIEELDFIVIATTHLHMGGFTIRANTGLEERVRAWSERFETLLDRKFPFHKIGVAHLTDSGLYGLPDELFAHLKVVKAIPETEYRRLFAKAAKAGIGIELNTGSIQMADERRWETEILPFRYAKEEGCKFYFGSDAHQQTGFSEYVEKANRIVEYLGLTESDKFYLPGL